MALILDTAIVLHVPRTGGTWCHVAMHELGLLRGVMHSGANYPHPSASEVRAIFGDDRQMACIVRHPIAWLRSYWASAYLAGGRGVERVRFGPSPWHEFAACEAPTFRDFIESYLTRCPGAVGRFMARYTEGTPFVGRTRSLVEDIGRFLAQADITIDRPRLDSIPPINVTRGRVPETGVGDLPADLAAAVRQAERDLLAAYYPEDLA